jgi:hypothetical protein
MALSGLPPVPKKNRRVAAGVARGIATLAAGVVQGLVARRQRQEKAAKEAAEKAEKAAKEAAEVARKERSEAREVERLGFSRAGAERAETEFAQEQEDRQFLLEERDRKLSAAKTKAERDAILFEYAKRDQAMQEEKHAAEMARPPKETDTIALREKWLSEFMRPATEWGNQNFVLLVKNAIEGKDLTDINTLETLDRAISSAFGPPPQVRADPAVQEAMGKWISRNFAANEKQGNRFLESFKRFIGGSPFMTRQRIGAPDTEDELIFGGP